MSCDCWILFEFWHLYSAQQYSWNCLFRLRKNVQSPDYSFKLGWDWADSRDGVTKLFKYQTWNMATLHFSLKLLLYVRLFIINFTYFDACANYAFSIKWDLFPSAHHKSSGLVVAKLRPCLTWLTFLQYTSDFFRKANIYSMWLKVVPQEASEYVVL